MLHPLPRDCMDVDSLWSYFVIRYVTVLSMNNKEGAELSVHIHANRHRDFDVLQCDKDPKFSTITDIHLTFTSPRRHEFQGAVERVIRTLTRKTGTLLANFGLDRDHFWGSVLFNRCLFPKRKVLAS